MKNVLIIVSGLSATGKTTLSKGMSEHLRLPLISKDEIKEKLFDGIGHGDREWGEKLNLPTYSLLTYFVEQELRARRSLMIEAPYDGDFPRAVFEGWQREYGFDCIQIICRADTEVLIDRFVARIGSPDRHPGHNDQAALEDFKESIRQVEMSAPLKLDGEIYEFDTTDLAAIEVGPLLEKLERQLSAGAPEQAGRKQWGGKLLAKLWFRR